MALNSQLLIMTGDKWEAYLNGDAPSITFAKSEENPDLPNRIQLCAWWVKRDVPVRARIQ
jgi:hypothetical protein